MLIFFTVLLFLAAAAIADAVRAFRTDGYGRWSEPPRSHVDEYRQWSLR
jgi:hypothetical protein